MALRLSIGAGRGRLVQQVLIESALLSIASCILGALVAMIAAPEVVSMLSTSRSIVRLDLQMDWRLVAFLAAMGSLVTVLFGLAPAVRASGVAPYSAMKTGGRQTAGVGLFRPLVAAQTAFGFVVLFVAGLCLASFVKLARIDPGFDQGGLAVARVKQVVPGATPGEVLHGDASSLAIWEQLVERLQRTPKSNQSACRAWDSSKARAETRTCASPAARRTTTRPGTSQVSPGFLETMRIPLIGGRDFEWRDARRRRADSRDRQRDLRATIFPGRAPGRQTLLPRRRRWHSPHRTSSALPPTPSTRAFANPLRRLSTTPTGQRPKRWSNCARRSRLRRWPHFCAASCRKYMPISCCSTRRLKAPSSAIGSSATGYWRCYPPSSRQLQSYWSSSDSTAC